MALYFFHLRDGADRLIDPDGRELPDLDEVRRLALHEARALVSQEALEGVIRLGQRIEVEDIGGAVVHRVEFADAVRVLRAAS